MRSILALAAILLLAACGRAPPPAAPQLPALTVPTPGPVLRDTLPAIEPRPHVPLPRGRPKPKRKAATTKTLPPPAYPCSWVRWAVSAYGFAAVDSKAREDGVTEDQRKAALACLKG